MLEDGEGEGEAAEGAGGGDADAEVATSRGPPPSATTVGGTEDLASPFALEGEAGVGVVDSSRLMEETPDASRSTPPFSLSVGTVES